MKVRKNVTVDPDDVDRWRVLADQNGMNQSEYLRHLLRVAERAHEATGMSLREMPPVAVRLAERVTELEDRAPRDAPDGDDDVHRVWMGGVPPEGAL